MKTYLIRVFKADGSISKEFEYKKTKGMMSAHLYAHYLGCDELQNNYGAVVVKKLKNKK